MTARRLKRAEQLSPPTRYELLARLAAGGMGAVYVGRAIDSDSDALVAIKRAHAHLLDDPTFREMFVAEARLASRIRHHQVVGVRDVDESDGELLLVMDYIEGASFADLLSATQKQGRRLPHSVGIRIVLDAARGLHAAHSIRDEAGKLLGMVHRDVSPHNVLVGIDGVARIVDFGVAKAIDHEGTNTQSGVLKGKAAYMAPEYLQGRRASTQSDIFSLGVVAWEGLTSRRLFRADDEVETMQRILDPTPPARLSDVVSIDAEIDAVVARALEKDRARRFATAAEFADALESAAKELDLIAAPAEVGALVESLVGEALTATRNVVREAIDASGVRPRRRRLEETKTAFVRPTATREASSDVNRTMQMPSIADQTQPSYPNLPAMTEIPSTQPLGPSSAPLSASARTTMAVNPGNRSSPNAGRSQPMGATVSMPVQATVTSDAVNATLQAAESAARTARGTLMQSPQQAQALLFAPTPAQLHRAPTLQTFAQSARISTPPKSSKSGLVFGAIALGAAIIGTGGWLLTRSHASGSDSVERVGDPTAKNAAAPVTVTQSSSAPTTQAVSVASAQPQATETSSATTPSTPTPTASTPPQTSGVNPIPPPTTAPTTTPTGTLPPPTKPGPPRPGTPTFKPPVNPYH